MLLTYWLIFISAFGAATILPFYSEFAVAAGLQTDASPVWIWLVASVGNTLGAIVNWWLGRYLIHFQHRRWFPFKPDQLGRGQQWFNRYGVWTLLLAWLPIGGDALTFIAGIMRVPLWLFVVLVGIGKSVRYAVVILMLLQVF